MVYNNAIMMTITIDGESFKDMAGFYDEIERNFFTGGQMGRNLNALDDVLWGGFGIFEDGEAIRLVWKNSKKSRRDLGYKATVQSLRRYKALSPRYVSRWEQLKYYMTEMAKLRLTGHPTCYDHIVECIRGHEHIEFIED